MRQWLIGLIGVFSLALVHAACPAPAFATAADFVLEVPLELRNFPADMNIGALSLEVRLFDKNNQSIGIQHVALNPTNTNPDGSFDYVQTVTINDWPLPLSKLKEAVAYHVRVIAAKAGAGFENMMKLDPSKPLVPQTSGKIVRP